MSNWSEIPPDLVAEITNRIEQYEDFENFGQVGRNWRKFKQDYVVNRPTNRQMPWFMLPEPLPGKFYSLYKRMNRPTNLPALIFDDDEDGKDMRSLFKFTDEGEEFLDFNWKYLSSKGWLIVFREGLNHILLLNPFTKRIIQTPPISHFYKYDLLYDTSDCDPFRLLYICPKAVLSNSPNGDDDDCFTLAMRIGRYTAVWNNKDANWVYLDKITGFACMDELIFYKGELYGVENFGKLVHSFTSKLVVDLKWVDSMATDKSYVVESAGRLLAVRRIVRFVDEETCDDYKTLSFTVLEVNVDTGDSKELKTIGSHALFIGFNSSISVEVSTSAGNCIKPNCIYYSDDLTEANFILGKDMGIYDLASGKVLEEIYYEGLSVLNPPLWVELPT